MPRPWPCPDWRRSSFAADALPALIVIAAMPRRLRTRPGPHSLGHQPRPQCRTGGAALGHRRCGPHLGPFPAEGAGHEHPGRGRRPAMSPSNGSHIHFASAAGLAVRLGHHIETAPSGTVLNLNVPNLPLSEILGVRQGAPGDHRPHLLTQAWGKTPRASSSICAGTEPAENHGGRGRPESDDTLTELGWAVVTPLASVTEDLRPEVGEVSGSLCPLCLPTCWHLTVTVDKAPYSKRTRMSTTRSARSCPIPVATDFVTSQPRLRRPPGGTPPTSQLTIDAISGRLFPLRDTGYVSVWFRTHQLSTTRGADAPGAVIPGRGKASRHPTGTTRISAPASRAVQLAAPLVPTCAP